MRADPPPPPARLTRTYGATLSGETDVAPDWLPFLARLAAELAPHSLADRLLAEGIEAIAYRAYLAGCEDGHRHGGAASYEDVLAWIAQVRLQQPQRAAVAALTAVEATVLRALAPTEPADTGTAD